MTTTHQLLRTRFFTRLQRTTRVGCTHEYEYLQYVQYIVRQPQQGATRERSEAQISGDVIKNISNHIPLRSYCTYHFNNVSVAD
jgi:hypothetical protein